MDGEGPTAAHFAYGPLQYLSMGWLNLICIVFVVDKSRLGRMFSPVFGSIQYVFGTDWEGNQEERSSLKKMKVWIWSKSFYPPLKVGSKNILPKLLPKVWIWGWLLPPFGQNPYFHIICIEDLPYKENISIGNYFWKIFTDQQICQYYLKLILRLI